MAWLPPVSLPDLGGRNYAQELYGVGAGIGDAVRQNRRDAIGDDQWNRDYARMLANDAQQQANADRNYALDLKKFEADQAAGAGGDEWYGSPQWFEREDGSMGFGVLSKSGEFREMQAPDGSQWAPSVTFQDTGTARVPMYTRGGGQAGEPLPVDVAGKQRQEEIGTAGGKVAATLGIVQASTDRMLKGIDDALQDPMLSAVTGPVGGNAPTWMSTDPGGAYRAQSRIDFILGNTFLQAYNDLRGAGQITEREGQAAMEAYSRLRTQGMDDQDYAQALMELRAEIVKLYQIAQQRAQMGAGVGQEVPQAPQAPPAPQGPPPMTTPGGVQFKRID